MQVIEIVTIVEYVDDEDWEGGDDEDEMVVGVVEHIVKVPAPKHHRSSVIIAPHEVGIGVVSAEEGNEEEEYRQQLLAKIAEIDRQIAQAKAAQKEPQRQDSKAPLHREDSLTSICEDSDDESTDEPINMPDLNVRATFRMSVNAARAVKKLREKLVTAQLRQRLREHAKRRNNMEVSIAAISAASKNLKPVPQNQKRDSSTWVNEDHPFLGELREVQAEVLPLWRKETYSYWI